MAANNLLSRLIGRKSLFVQNSPQADMPVWKRPTDWPQLPVIGDTDQKLAALFGVFPGNSNFAAFLVSGNHTVDWGDGSSPENVAAGVIAQHQYDYATVTNPVTARGYKTVTIVITPQAGQNLTSIDFNKKHTTVSNAISTNAAEAQWLDISVTGPSLTTLRFGALASVVASWTMLENVRVGPNALTTATVMFANCQGLRAVQRLELNSTCLSTVSMFENCGRLISIPNFNTSGVTTAARMFAACNMLEAVPAFNFSACLDFTNCFLSCIRLKTVPAFKLPTSGSVIWSNIFMNCSSLRSVPLMDTQRVTSMNSAFEGCQSLVECPTFNTALVTTMGAMFRTCYQLAALPPFNFAVCTTINAMLADCYSLTEVVIPSLPAASVSISGMMSLTSNIAALKRFEINCTNVTAASTGWPQRSLSSVILTGLKSTTSGTMLFSTGVLTKEGLEALFTSLGTHNANETLGVTGHPGSSASAAVGTTSGSATVTAANTAGMVVGQYITGVGISDGGTFTIDTTADTLTRTAHGIVTDQPVFLHTLTTSTGIVARTLYYAVNVTANTLQLALTAGGAAINITGSNGTGVLRARCTITAIVANTNITISIPASATGSPTAYFGTTDRYIAILKGWGVAG